MIDDGLAPDVATLNEDLVQLDAALMDSARQIRHGICGNSRSVVRRWKLIMSSQANGNAEAAEGGEEARTLFGNRVFLGTAFAEDVPAHDTPPEDDKPLVDQDFNTSASAPLARRRLALRARGRHGCERSPASYKPVN
jgi:hypothetical protein